MSAVWRGLGGDHPLPHAPLELPLELSPLGGVGRGAVQWNASVSWEVRWWVERCQTRCKEIGSSRNNLMKSSGPAPRVVDDDS